MRALYKYHQTRLPQSPNVNYGFLRETLHCFQVTDEMQLASSIPLSASALERALSPSLDENFKSLSLYALNIFAYFVGILPLVSLFRRSKRILFDTAVSTRLRYNVAIITRPT